MLPGKKYTPEDILQIVWRYRWVLLVPFAVVSAGTAVYSRYLPDRFRSEALIMVVPQRVPESYVRSTVTTQVSERLRSIREQIMSRTRLERVILEFNLYPEQRKNGIMQDVVERMQREVVVTPGLGDTFRVGFVGDNPVVVRKVAEKITSLFIDESLRQRETLAEGTNQFLESQLEDARTRLVEHEKRVEAYRRQYGAELPTQLESNMQAISNVQMEIQALLQSINQNQNRRLLVERALAELESDAFTAALPIALPPATGPIGPGGTPVLGNTPAEQLVAARAQLTLMLQRLKEGHPDVVRMKKIVADIEQKAEADALRQPLSGPDAGLSPLERARQRKILELKTELALLDEHVAQQQTEEKRLRGQAMVYQARVEATPTRESEMIELTRDYGTLNTLYLSLLTKREDAKLSANLERRQIGEQFEVLDPARLPERPFSPNRRLINYTGMGIGLGIGVLFVGLLEYRDRSFKTDDEIKMVLGMPVLAVVPLMRSDAEKRRRRHRSVAVGFLLGSGVLACLAVVTYTFVR